MKYVIVDLDGTLANVDHRVNLVRRKKKWFKKFYDLCYKDKVNEWCASLIRALGTYETKVLLVTARPVTHKAMTEKWLTDNRLGDVELHMVRKDEHDFTPDVELKRNWLYDTFCNGKRIKTDVLFVVDDRKRVVDMWRAEGLVCLQCYEWEEFKEK